MQKLRGRPSAWQAEAPKYDPVVAATGPALENIQRDGAVDLFTFPSPLWHEKDGGRYIGTGCSVVTKDLDSDWVNVGTYRVHGARPEHVGLDMVPGKHGRIQYDKHMAAGKRFPVVIVCGGRSARLPDLGDRGAVRDVRVQLHRRDPAASRCRCCAAS